MQSLVLNWSQQEALIAIAVAAGIAIASFFFIWRSFKRYRLIHDTPSSKIRSAAQGVVELQGHAEAFNGKPIYSPLTRQACCWWRYRIERRVGAGKTSRWSRVEADESTALLTLADSTGEALIDPDGAEISGSSSKIWYGNSRHPSNIVSGISVFAGNYRFSEEILAIGSELYVLGDLKSQGPASEFDLHQAVGDKLRQWKQNQKALLARFDANADGKINEGEWQQARAAARDEIEQQYAPLIEQDPIPFVQKPANGVPMLLSSLPPQKLAKRYLGKTLIAGPLFIAAGALAIWIASLRGLI